MDERRAWKPGDQPAVCLEQDCISADGEKWLHSGYISGLTNELEEKLEGNKEKLNLQIFDMNSWVDDGDAI